MHRLCILALPFLLAGSALAQVSQALPTCQVVEPASALTVRQGDGFTFRAACSGNALDRVVWTFDEGEMDTQTDRPSDGVFQFPQTLDGVGTHRIGAKAFDAAGNASAAAEWTVQVKGPGESAAAPATAGALPECALKRPAAALTVRQGDWFEFQLVCQDDDLGRVLWYRDWVPDAVRSGPGGLVAVGYDFPDPGTYAIAAEAVDRLGQRSATVLWTVRVQAGGQSVEAPATQGAAPSCQAAAPSAAFAARQGDSFDFHVDCQDDGDFDGVRWYLDWSLHGVTPGSGSGGSLRRSFAFDAVRTYHIEAEGIDVAGQRSRTLCWTVAVRAVGGPLEAPAAAPCVAGAATPPGSQGGGLGLLGIDPVGAFSAVVGAIVGIGGLWLAVAQYRRHRRGGDEAEKEAAVAVHVEQKVGTNTGTVIGQAGQVVLQAPAPTVPSGVPPHKQALYLSLARAHDALDLLPVGEATLEARELVGDLMGKLARGEIPVRESRRPAAAAVARVLAGTVPSAERAALSDAAGQLGR